VKPTIVILAGDGIGPDVIAQARKVLAALESRLGDLVDICEYPIGGQALEATGTSLPPETLEAARASSAVLLGAVGHPAWDNCMPRVERPIASLLRLRTALGGSSRFRVKSGPVS